MRNELARDLCLDGSPSTGPLLDSLLQQRATTSSVTSFQPPHSITSTLRQDQENSNTTANSTPLATQTQPATTDSLLAALNTHGHTTSDSSKLFANPTGAGSFGMDLSPFDQFSQTRKPDSLPPLTENSLPNLDADARPRSSFEPVQATDGSEGDQHVGIGGNASLPLPGGEEQVNGRSTDTEELDDFFSKKPARYT